MGKRLTPESRARHNRQNHESRKRHGRSGGRWAKIRQRVIDAAGGRCDACGDVATQAHKLTGGYHTPDVEDYVALCSVCHGVLHHQQRPGDPVPEYDEAMRQSMRRSKHYRWVFDPREGRYVRRSGIQFS